MTPAQNTTLKAAINAEADAAFVVMRIANNEQGMADWYNVASTFVCWKPVVTIVETGQVFDGPEWASMTTANHTRLQTVAHFLLSYSPAVQGLRDMFNDIWSGAGGVLTRAALLVLWKRFALRGEKVFASGTGTDLSPGTFSFQGQITAQNISDARALP